MCGNLGNWRTFLTFISLPKRGDLKHWANYRTICLAYKQDPSSDHTGKDLSEDQNRNCKRTGRILTRKGTRDQITNLRILMHKARHHQHALYVLCGLKKHLTQSPIISSGWLWWTWDILCTWLTSWPVAGIVSEWSHVKKGVQQDCVLSLYLFNILVELVMRETLDGFQGGLQIGWWIVTNLHYKSSTGAGDRGITAENMEKSQHIDFNEEC